MIAKPRILALYYTQSGQLKDILDSLFSTVLKSIEIDYVAIQPQQAFPFPWTATTFFDAMPESVEHLPAPIHPLPNEVFQKEYDLIILGYQPWFLNPSQPITAFLQSDDARILNGKRVITVIGCRNMWLHAQEKVKQYLIQNQATLIGNICLFDTNTNIISTLTVIRWTFTGQKAAGRWLPAAGVQDKDIQEASRFGKIILSCWQLHQLNNLQNHLIEAGAIKLDPGLVLLEQRGIKNFRFWSKYIREKGGPGASQRLSRVLLFKKLLIVGIFILSPISSLAAFIKLQFHKKRLSKDVDYFKGISFESNRI
ncbi:MAG: dialkylresorcinol condensing enzyme DarA [Bacteroidia bacterium]|nr:MAG: dialkylresorcinol condensing enzyme DarA [Bacteroidia bacterium]